MNSLNGAMKSLSLNLVIPRKDYVALIEKGYERALAAIGGGDYDLVVLDEYNMALFFELISWDKTKAFCSMLVIQKRNSYSEAVGLLKN